MSLIRREPQLPDKDEELIKLCEAAEILCLDESTIRKGDAGTQALTLVRFGVGKRQAVRLIKSEVLTFKQSHIDAARGRKR